MDRDDVSVAEEVPRNVLNVNKPDVYRGERHKLENWLIQWDLFFLFQGESVAEEKRVTLVASYMRDAAFNWIKPFLLKYRNDSINSEDINEWMEDFDEFKSKIRVVFGVTNEPTIARRDIQRIRQTQSAADYAAEFQQLASNTEWDENALMTMFRQGLKPKVKEELMRTGASTDTLDTLMNTAIDIDTKLYELQRELRDDPRARGALNERRPPPKNPWRNNLANRGNRGGRYQPNMGQQRTHNNTRSGYYGPEAMDLSNINKGPEKGHDRWNKPNQGSGKDKSKVTCYGCGKQGHYARDCRQKNKVVRQLNMITSDYEEHDADASEWEVIADGNGRLMEDPESGPSYDDGYINPAALQRAPTPHPEIYTDAVEYLPTTIQVFTKEDRQQRQARRDKRRETKRARDQQIQAENDAAYAQMCQELIIPSVEDSMTENWCDKSLREYHEQCARTSRIEQEQFIQQYAESIETGVEYLKTQYGTDPRNPHHELLSFTACFEDGCAVHYSDKVGSGFFPTNKHYMKHWTKCRSVCCEMHLIDKRMNKEFPGHDTPLDKGAQQLVINGRCTNERWQLCLNPECKTHEGSKQRHGFGGENPFLGLRRGAPGIDPSTALEPIAN